MFYAETLMCRRDKALMIAQNVLGSLYCVLIMFDLDWFNRVDVADS